MIFTSRLPRTWRVVTFFTSFVALPCRASVTVYKADITEIIGTGSGVLGTVAVFVPDMDDDGQPLNLGYGGFLSNAPSDLDATNCTATNGCGVHIHSGTSCGDKEGQGGHYFVDPVKSDPWVDQQYSSDTSGSASFSSLVNIGTSEVDGKPFIVHAKDGSRIGCGLLKKVSSSAALLTSVKPIGNTSSVSGSTIAFQIGETDQVCYYGSASGLEKDVISTSCASKNGCGTHIHSGTSCATAELQGGHFYDTNTLSSDPWAKIGYLSTDSNGNAQYTSCLSTGATANIFLGKAFVVHAVDGSRVACGTFDDTNGTSGAPKSPVWSAVSTFVFTFACFSALFF